MIKTESKGVYNALNCGIDVAINEWTLFLHSDDELNIDISEIEKILKTILTSVACFSVQIQFDLSIRKYRTNRFTNILRPPPHTGMVFRTSVLKKIKFDEDYKISGDYKQILTIKNIDDKSFTPVFKDLVIMSAGGLSTKFKNLKMSLIEDRRVLKEMNVRFALFKVFIKKLIKIDQLRLRKYSNKK